MKADPPAAIAPVYSDFMAVKASWYASQLRQELGLRNRLHARGRAHVESFGNPPVIVYAPEAGRHGNFFDDAYAAMTKRPDWIRRFDKIHAQGRSLPKVERKWRELDSSMSSDALLMNVFCTPGVIESQAVRQMLGVERGEAPIFGWRARVPLSNGRLDRTEVDMRWGSLLAEAKLTEGDFQARIATAVEAYLDFDAVFDRGLLPRVALEQKRRREPTEFPEDYSQQAESSQEITSQEQVWHFVHDGEEPPPKPADTVLTSRSTRWPELEQQPATGRFQAGVVQGGKPFPESAEAYSGYQLIRNVLAAYAQSCSFCLICDARRPDLLEAWFQVMAAVKSAEMRVRLKVVTWQELADVLPQRLQRFLDLKYGIVGLRQMTSSEGWGRASNRFDF